MKTVFFKDGVVISVGISYDNGAVFSHSDSDVISLVVDDCMEVDTNWIISEVNGVTVFTPPVARVIYPTLSPIQFKLLFTSQERIAIKASRTTDPILEDAYEILDDPRLTVVDMGLESTRNLIYYLVQKTLITPERSVQILLGIIL